jgi:hypothetical protein
MAGRPNKYETNVKPRFAEILEWLQIGATEKEIAENLGVNQKVFCRYKKQYSELNNLIKKGRKQPVQAIKAALFRRATGFQYTETKVIRKQIVLDGEDESKIPATLVQTEESTKMVLPDPASAMILLKHWDKENGWTNDPAALELKKQEFEFKKQHAESEDW